MKNYCGNESEINPLTCGQASKGLRLDNEEEEKMGGGGILDSAVSPSTNWIMKDSFSKHAYTALYLDGGGG